MYKRLIVIVSILVSGSACAMHESGVFATKKYKLNPCSDGNNPFWHPRILLDYPSVLKIFPKKAAPAPLRRVSGTDVSRKPLARAKTREEEEERQRGIQEVRERIEQIRMGSMTDPHEIKCVSVEALFAGLVPEYERAVAFSYADK